MLVVSTDQAHSLGDVLGLPVPASGEGEVVRVLTDLETGVGDAGGGLLDALAVDTLALLARRWRGVVGALGRHFPDSDVDRHCGVNSPLHYLIVDIAIYYIKKYCSSCQRILVTNADNHYSPLFFEFVYNSVDNGDIAMTNMLSRGRPLQIREQSRAVLTWERMR